MALSYHSQIIEPWGRTPRLPQLECGARAFRHEYLFHRHVLGAMFIDQGGEAIEKNFKAGTERNIAEANHTAGNVHLLLAVALNNAETRFTRAGVDAENQSHGRGTDVMEEAERNVSALCP